MDLINFILTFFGNYTPLISFFGAIIGGEETLIFLSILSSHGFLNPWVMLIFFYIGISVSDSIWYFLGKSKAFYWMLDKKIISRAFLYWDKVLNNATKNSDFQALFFTKFLYGTRIPTIMYLSKERLSLNSFITYTLLTNLIWVPAVFIIGWSAGKGITLATNITDNLILYLVLIGLVLLLFTIFIRTLSGFVKKWLKKRQKQ